MLFLVRAILLGILCLCVASGPGEARVEKARPKLVLAIIVDQFRYDYLLRFKEAFTGGFATLLDHGAVFTDAHYPQFPTVTAVGHSTFLSGATPSVSGIIGNEWFERTPQFAAGECSENSGGVVTSVADPSTCLVGLNRKKQGASPRRLLVSTIGDELKMARPITDVSSRVFGLSLKDRGAILTSGHMANAAFWFDSDMVVSSTYYAPELPRWISDFNAGLRDRIDKYKWYPTEKPDGVPFCAIKPSDGARPCGYLAGEKKDGKLENTPLANVLVEELAEQIIAREQLGRRDATDILTISFSANDYVGHELGPDTPEVRDIAIHTDRLLKSLFDFLQRSGLGGGKTLVVLTADHGVAATPKANRERKMPGGYLYGSEIKATIEAALTARFGKGSNEMFRWVSNLNNGFLYLNYREIADRGLDTADVRRVAADAARAVAHIARVYNRDELLRGAAGADRIDQAVQLGFYGPRSGDLFLVPEPNYMFALEPGKFDTGTTHFTPYTYDTHVPLIFYAPGIIRSGAVNGRVLVNDVAPTLSAILGIERPSGSFGRVLSEILE